MFIQLGVSLLWLSAALASPAPFHNNAGNLVSRQTFSAACGGELEQHGSAQQLNAHFNEFCQQDFTANTDKIYDDNGVRYTLRFVTNAVACQPLECNTAFQSGIATCTNTGDADVSKDSNIYSSCGVFSWEISSIPTPDHTVFLTSGPPAATSTPNPTGFTCTPETVDQCAPAVVCSAPQRTGCVDGKCTCLYDLPPFTCTPETVDQCAPEVTCSAPQHIGCVDSKCTCVSDAPPPPPPPPPPAYASGTCAFHLMVTTNCTVKGLGYAVWNDNNRYTELYANVVLKDAKGKVLNDESKNQLNKGWGVLINDKWVENPSVTIDSLLPDPFKLTGYFDDSNGGGDDVFFQYGDHDPWSTWGTEGKRPGCNNGDWDPKRVGFGGCVDGMNRNMDCFFPC